MRIARKQDIKKITRGVMTAYEYPKLSDSLHGAVIELRGRYPEKGRVVNEKCAEIGYVIEGSGKIFIENEEIEFSKGDQIFIAPGEQYYWNANATMFMPCAPAWYPEQHKEIE